MIITVQENWLVWSFYPARTCFDFKKASLKSVWWLSGVRSVLLCCQSSLFHACCQNFLPLWDFPNHCLQVKLKVFGNFSLKMLWNRENGGWDWILPVSKLGQIYTVKGGLWIKPKYLGFLLSSNFLRQTTTTTTSRSYLPVARRKITFYNFLIDSQILRNFKGNGCLINVWI